MQPGYLPMRPNGDPMFRGSQFNSRINGGQAHGDRELLRRRRVRLRQRAPAKPREHAAGRGRAGSQGHHDDLFGAVRAHERRVHRVHGASPARTRFTAASTSIWRDDAFNKKGFFAELAAKTPMRNDNYGFTLAARSDPSAGTRRSSSPTSTSRASARAPRRLRQHDAHRRLQERRLQRAADRHPDRHRRAGRPIMGGQIFNPPTTRTVNGVPVRDPYPGQRIPASDPLRSQSSPRGSRR